MADFAVTYRAPRPPRVAFLETVADRVTSDMVRDRAEQLAPVLADLLHAEAAVGHCVGEGLLNPPTLAVARALVIDPVSDQEAPRG